MFGFLFYFFVLIYQKLLSYLISEGAAHKFRLFHRPLPYFTL